jgi:hypothetical protein
MECVPTSVLCNDRCHLGEGPTYDVPTARGRAEPDVRLAGP